MLMHKLIFLIALAIAANLDNLGVGIAYGLNQRHISASSNFVIAGISTVLTFVAMAFGQWMAQKVSVQAANALGAVIIIGVGFWVYAEPLIDPIASLISRWFWQHLRQLSSQHFPHPVLSWLKRNRPEAGSQHLVSSNCLYRRPRHFIGLKETMVLGVSLALNAMAGGFGASLAGHNAYFISTAIGGASYITINVGQKASKTYFSKWLGPFAQKIAGLLLILIGAYELFF